MARRRRLFIPVYANSLGCCLTVPLKAEVIDCVFFYPLPLETIDSDFIHLSSKRDCGRDKVLRRCCFVNPVKPTVGTGSWWQVICHRKAIKRHFSALLFNKLKLEFILCHIPTNRSRGRSFNLRDRSSEQRRSPPSLVHRLERTLLCLSLVNPVRSRCFKCLCREGATGSLCVYAWFCLFSEAEEA